MPNPAPPVLRKEAIAPALTPEEWAEWCVTVSVYQQIGYDALQQFVIGEGQRIVPIQRQHAVAALALHGMPYGFTAQDVAALNEEIATYGPSGWTTQVLISLRDRIDALLPPSDSFATLLPPSDAAAP